MKFTFVNHASFILEYKNVRLITDPWLEFTAFDNGWALHSKTRLAYDDFKDITHIWFSHEHPDHFSPPVIKKIPEQYRASITVLYQETIDRKVVDFCKKAGFKNVIELPVNKYYSITDGLECLCNPFTHGDSWIFFKTPELGVLNINDCIIADEEVAAKVKRQIGDHKIDILFTQFGYANKVGNDDDIHLREKASAEKLMRITAQYNVFKPDYIVPFASYIWFCHEENAYMNNGMNQVRNVCDFIEDNLKTNAVVLYPGDKWIPGNAHDNNAAIQRYETDIKDILSQKKYLVAKAVEENELLKNASAYMHKLTAANWALRIFAKRVNIYVSDYQQAYQLHLGGLKKTKLSQAQCDISLGSQSLNYSFTTLWGSDTLQVNARYQNPAGGDSFRFFFYGFIAARNNAGKTMTFKNFLAHKIQSLFYKDTA